MNSIRQFFTLRSLAAFRQSINANPLASNDDDDRPCFAAGRVQIQTLAYNHNNHQPSEQQKGFWDYGTLQESINKFKNSLPVLNVGNALSSTNESSSASSNLSLSTLGSLSSSTRSEKVKLGYFCKVCQRRSTKNISKHAYTYGVVIVACPGCETNHLIIDNVGWFKNSKGLRNIEDVIAANVGNITKITVNERGELSQP